MENLDVLVEYGPAVLRLFLIVVAVAFASMSGIQEMKKRGMIEDGTAGEQNARLAGVLTIVGAFSSVFFETDVTGLGLQDPAAMIGVGVIALWAVIFGTQGQYNLRKKILPDKSSWKDVSPNSPSRPN